MSATSPITRSSGAGAASARPRTQPSRRTFCGSPERTTPAPRAWWRSSTARKDTATSSPSTPPNFSAPSHRPLQTRPITARYCRPSASSTAKPVLTGRLQFTRRWLALGDQVRHADAHQPGRGRPCRQHGPARPISRRRGRSPRNRQIAPGRWSRMRRYSPPIWHRPALPRHRCSRHGRSTCARCCI
jgi:hypothetical protein